tara:strand:+ start:945 stop:2636 length:1692 start_codon:yes stop_codon:yes gene_type:complete
LAFVATAGSTWLVSDLAVEALRKSTGQNLEEIAVQFRDKIDLDLSERYSDFKVLSAFVTPLLEKGRVAEVAPVIDSLQHNFSSYAWIGLVSPEGIVIESNKGLLRGADVSQRPWFTQALKQPYMGDAHDAILLAEKLYNPGSAPLRFLDMALPLRSENGTLLGVLGAHLYLDWVANMGQSLMMPLRKRLNAEFIVADQSGVVLIGPDGSERQRLPDALIEQVKAADSGYLTTKLAFNDTSAESQDYLVGFTRLQGKEEYESFNWLVLVRKPAAEAFVTARDLQTSLILVGLLVAPILLLFVSLVARWTTRPLLSMTLEASQLDPEKPDTLIRLREDYAEVKTLSSVLRDLIRRLASKTQELNELNANLEQRVADRTQELNQVNLQLEATARTDCLTGLNNRGYYFELGEAALKKATRSNSPVAVIMFDADHFKQVNDSYGHAAGDRALVHLARMALQALRDTDILARVGGEEFAIVLENTTEQLAFEVAERLRASIESTPLVIDEHELVLTVSVGVACLIPGKSDRLDTLLVLADNALYTAKAGGRNRVCRYSEIASVPGSAT